MWGKVWSLMREKEDAEEVRWRARQTMETLTDRVRSPVADADLVIW